MSNLRSMELIYIWMLVQIQLTMSLGKNGEHYLALMLLIM